MKASITAGGLGLALIWALPTMADEPDVLEDGRLMAIAENDPQVDACDPRLMSAEAGSEQAAREGDLEELDEEACRQLEAQQRDLEELEDPDRARAHDAERFDDRERRDVVVMDREDLEELETTEVRTVATRDESRGARTWVMLGGGVDGYTHELNRDLDIGPAWGVNLGVGGRFVGVEVGYNGAANQIDSGVGDPSGGGVDVLRHAGQAALKLNLSPTPFHPYLLGGVGIEHRNFRNGEELGFSDGLNGYVPAGAGLRWNLGAFTADLRVTYNFLFEEDFAPGNPTGDRYQGTLMLGGTM